MTSPREEPFDLFVSYAHTDNGDGWVAALVEAIKQTHARFRPAQPWRLFFDTHAIHTLDDWENRIGLGLRTARVMLALVSPAYFRSEWCRREWQTFRAHERRRGRAGGCVAVLYLETEPSCEGADERDEWRQDLWRRQHLDLRAWRPRGWNVLGQAPDCRDTLQQLVWDVDRRLVELSLLREAGPGEQAAGEAELLQQRIERLRDAGGDFRDRLTNCLQAVACPAHALTLARSDAERLVKRLFEDLNLKPPAMLDGCLRELEKPEVMSRGLVPLEILSLLHTVRVLGNKAAHDALKIEATTNDVHLIVLALLRVVEWYFVEFERGPRVELPAPVAPLRRAGVPLQAPPLPGHSIRRPAEEARLERDLLCPDEGPGVVVSAVFGLGGIGKSTLAAAVVQGPAVQERFGDGVLWVTLGQNPELLSLAGQWIRDLGDHDFRALDLRAASGRLRQLLQGRALLLVVDDAWHSEHVEPFRVGGPRCRLLVTTRRAGIADILGAIRHELDVLEPGQAVELLATRRGRPLATQERGQARRLAEALGRLPLALELAGVRLARGVSWDDLLAALEREVAALEALEDPAERRKGKARLLASLNLSLRALYAEDEAASRCFAWLGVLPDDTTLVAPMAATVWGMAEAEAEEVLEYLWGEALLQPATAVRLRGREWRAYRVHDLLHDCARRLLAAPAVPHRAEEMPGLGLARPEAHRQLLARYRDRTQGGQWHTLAADAYIHGQLVWHLKEAGDVEGLHALLREETAAGRNGWYEANERLGQTATFADGVVQGWRLADETFRAGQPALGLQCRYALVTASLNSLAGNIPPALLEALVRHGVWPVEQALAYARRTPDAQQKVKALAALAPFQSMAEREPVLAEALAAARALGDEGARFWALAALAPQLAEHPALLAEALAAAHAIGDEGSRSAALAALAPQLGEHPALLAEALAAARAIGDEGSRSAALAALAPQLAEQERPVVLAEALAAARAIGDESNRSYALALLAPQLPEQGRPVVLAEALAAARAIGDEWSRSDALAALAPQLPEQGRPVVLAEALAAARAIENKNGRSDALATLAPQLGAHPSLLAEALDAARAIENEIARSRVLAALAPQLREHPALLAEALAAARAMGSEESRSAALAALARQLAEHPALLAEALAAARAIGYEESRSQALAALAPHLAYLAGPALSALWMETLPLLAARTRQHLLVDLRALTPVLAALAGSDAPTELREVAQAVSDVARWWP